MSDAERDELRQLREEKAARENQAADKREAKRARREAAAVDATRAEDADRAAEAASRATATPTCKSTRPHKHHRKPDDDSDSDDDDKEHETGEQPTPVAAASPEVDYEASPEGSARSPTDLDGITSDESPLALEVLVACALLASLVGRAAKRDPTAASPLHHRMKHARATAAPPPPPAAVVKMVRGKSQRQRCPPPPHTLLALALLATSVPHALATRDYRVFTIALNDSPLPNAPTAANLVTTRDALFLPFTDAQAALREVIPNAPTPFWAALNVADQSLVVIVPNSLAASGLL